MWKLAQEGRLTDVIIKCNDGAELKAHKVALCAASPYFKEDAKVVELDAPAATVKAMLEYIYTNRLSAAPVAENAQLLYLSHECGVGELEIAIIDQITKEMNNLHKQAVQLALRAAVDTNHKDFAVKFARQLDVDEIKEAVSEDRLVDIFEAMAVELLQENTELLKKNKELRKDLYEYNEMAY